MRDKIEKLLLSDIKGTEIENKTGVSRAVITKLRKGQREVGGLTLDTCEKLCKFYDEMNDNV
ncbi:helix-turn-helix domain-containing protein [Macrococcus armenti]|uniref:Helix-turn-helix transcriptional regulator n=1 Tax=Macrococcus armenti TaxID=2875764 RepID=A0ABY3ZX81_9STAP|nr:helix-turn-helix transcriptional regulator [Macrococcus armenti]UOB21529.1 helix-turn-helix transcriptional regulator [Macrococcus armenti]